MSEQNKAPNLYPRLTILHLEGPNRLWAAPLLGALAKFVILIPVFIWIYILTIALLFFLAICSLVVFFTGAYWHPAYTFNLGLMRLMTKVGLFFYGLTDRYPGFGFGVEDPLISLDWEEPQSPNRLFAIPFLGYLARIVLAIPYLIYSSVIAYAAYIGVIVSSFPVLFVGRYPESTYELARDSVRVYLASYAYFTGLSDSYPSFWISMNHRTIKIILIIVGLLLLIGSCLPQ